MSSSSPTPAVPALAAVQPLYAGLLSTQIGNTDPLTAEINVLSANLQNLSNYAYTYAANGSQQTASNNVNSLQNQITVNSVAIANLGTSTQASITQLAGNTSSSFGVSNAVQSSIGGKRVDTSKWACVACHKCGNDLCYLERSAVPAGRQRWHPGIGNPIPVRSTASRPRLSGIPDGDQLCEFQQHTGVAEFECS